MNTTVALQIITDHVPQQAVSYCVGLLEKYQFELFLKKSRVTKIGDFTFRRGQPPRLTINEDINTYLFLITYIHEVAHLVVHRTFARTVKSHGQMWKQTFCQLMTPVMHEGVFPAPLLALFRKHMQNPAASTFSDSALTKMLHQYDTERLLFLYQLPEGSIFCFRGKWFKKGKRKRTRVECQKVGSRVSYLIPDDVPIEAAQPVLF